jgi:hypothetical protein
MDRAVAHLCFGLFSESLRRRRAAVRELEAKLAAITVSNR